MKKHFLLLSIGTLSLLFPGCTQEEDITPEPVLLCESNTDYFGHFLLDNEQLCWNSNYPFSIGEGRIDLPETEKVWSFTSYFEYDTDVQDQSLVKRSFKIQSPFDYEDFHNLETFPELLDLGPQNYAKEPYDISDWQVTYILGDEIYTTLGTDNSNSIFDILTLEKSEETGYHDDQGNLYDFRMLSYTARLSCTLSNNEGTTIELKDALIKGWISNLFQIE